MCCRLGPGPERIFLKPAAGRRRTSWEASKTLHCRNESSTDDPLYARHRHVRLRHARSDEGAATQVARHAVGAAIHFRGDTYRAPVRGMRVRPDHNGAVLRDFVCYVAVRHWDESAVDHHAEIPFAPQVQRADDRRKRPDGRRSCPQSLGGHRDEQRAEIRARARTQGRKLGVTRHIGFVAKAATGAAKESGHPGGPERRSRSIGTPCAEGRRKRHGGSGPCSPIS